MADEQQYYHPIIQAYLQRRQQDQSALEAANRDENAKAQLAQEKQHQTELLKQSQQRIDHETALQDANLKLATAAHEAANLQARVGTLQHIGDIIKSGANPEILKGIQGVNYDPGVSAPNPSLPGVDGGSPQTLPPTQMTQPSVQFQGSEPFNTSAFGTPSAEADRIKQLAAAKAGGAAEGALPAKLVEQNNLAANTQATQGQQQQNQRDLQKSANDFKAGLTDKQIQSNEKIAHGHDATSIFTNQATNAARIQVAGMGGTGSDDENSTVQHGVIAALTGQTKVNASSPFGRAVIAGVQQAGGQPVDPKTIEQLKAMQGLVPVFDELKRFANKNLPDESGSTGKVGAQIKGMVQGYVAKASPFPSDVRNDLAQIKSKALNIGRQLEGMGGRPLAAQLQLDIDSITSPGITKQQAMDRVQNLLNMYVNKEQDQILGGFPDAQKQMIYKATGVTPSFMIGKPDKLPNGATLDKDESIKEGKAVYVK